MANVELYFGVENIALTNGQRNQLIAALQTLGAANSDPQPSRRNHWRIRSDQQAIILQALFDDTTLTIAAFKQRLATIFSVAVGTISHTVTTPTFATIPSTVVTFTHSGTDYMRVALFGGTSASLAASRLEVLAYIAANAAAWEA